MNQTTGTDLQFKAPVWEDRHGETCLSYNDPQWPVDRDQLGPEADSTSSAISVGMKKMKSYLSRNGPTPVFWR